MDNENNNSVILHLSDLHFDGCVNWHRDKLLTELVTTINSLDKCWKSNVICITGDIADKNSEDGYINAAECLEGFVSKFNISKQAIFVCPGNNDLYLDFMILGEVDIFLIYLRCYCQRLLSSNIFISVKSNNM